MSSSDSSRPASAAVPDGKLETSMRRHAQFGSGKQIPLALNPMAGPESTRVLRMAYARLQLSRRLTFEQVMCNRAVAIGVRNLAEAIVRRTQRQFG